jgi:hypothetical protein
MGSPRGQRAWYEPSKCVPEGSASVLRDHAHGIPKSTLANIRACLAGTRAKIPASGATHHWELIFLEAFNKVWKKYLLFHINNGGGKKAAGMEEDQEQALSKSSKAGEHRRKANRHSTMDYQSLRSLWALSDPRLAEMAERWAPSSVIGDTLIDLYGR